MRRILLLSLISGMLAMLALAGTVYSRGNQLSAASETPGGITPVAAQSEPSAASECERGTLSEQQAHSAVWALPEVEARAQELRGQGARPFTMTWSEPQAEAAPGTEGAAYVIYFGEDHGSHTVHVATFLVDSSTGHVTDGGGVEQKRGAQEREASER